MQPCACFWQGKCLHWCPANPSPILEDGAHWLQILEETKWICCSVLLSFICVIQFCFIEFVSLLFLWEWHYVLPSLSSSDAITCLNCSDSSRPDHLTPLLIRFCAQSHTHQWISAPTYCPNYCWFVRTTSALKMFLYPLTQFTLRTKSVIYASEIWCSVQLSQCQQYCFNKSQFVESTHLPSVCSLLNVKNIIWAGFLGQTVQSYLCSFIGKYWKYYSGFFV